jgi:hypothetical protein
LRAVAIALIIWLIPSAMPIVSQPDSFTLPSAPVKSLSSGLWAISAPISILPSSRSW